VLNEKQQDMFVNHVKKFMEKGRPRGALFSVDRLMKFFLNICKGD
jgi:hypothetical protein